MALAPTYNLNYSQNSIFTDNRLNTICRFAGALTRAQAIQQMQACDIFILPSLGETFGIVLGEAMACGKPVIATRCGGPEYIVTEKTGILVAPRDVTALTDAIIFMLNAYSTFDPEHIRQSVLHRFGEASFLEAVASHYKNIHKPIRDV
jgi:glycosyltransferase involved in cell wall biosynthesis